MDRKVRIPVRIQDLPAGFQKSEHNPGHPGVEPGAQLPAEEANSTELAAQPGIEPAGDARYAPEIDWHDRALRLQAEMDNYRKRQQRLAQDQIQDERERLLAAFLDTVDNLERALQSDGDARGLRQGVQLVHREALQFLAKEGVEQVEALGRPFDPAWHEAVASVPHTQANAASETVVQVLQPGYRLGDELLRPARVVVAV